MARTGSSWEYTLYIPHGPRAAGICRRTLRDILTTHHLPTLINPAELLASELIANALRHTTGPAALKLRQAGTSFRLGAWDTDPTPPKPTHPHPRDESGRGLHLVRACSDDWGWFQVNPKGTGTGTGTGTGGKYVWCELDTRKP